MSPNTGECIVNSPKAGVCIDFNPVRPFLPMVEKWVDEKKIKNL